jgi:cyanophycinase
METRPTRDQLKSPSPKPIYCFADSRLLFWNKGGDSLFLDGVVRSVGSERPSIAYIGASNGEFYREIFLPAFEQVDAGECRMILAEPTPEDRAFLEHADVILLAGGSVEVGWRAFEGNGFKTLIEKRYLAAATLVGISAGAVQLGRGGLTNDESALLFTFGFLPFYVAAHEERDDWRSLRRISSFLDGPTRGIGIPTGGGFIYSDGDLVPVLKPVFEIRLDGSNLR